MSATDVQSIPIIDLASFGPGGSHDERAKASQALYNACHTLGFANIIGHGVSDALLQEAFHWSKKLFDLPRDAKMKAPHPASAMPHRGYSAPGIEKVYSKDDLEKEEASDGQGTSLRRIQDFKVRKTLHRHGRMIWHSGSGVLTDIFRKAMKLGASIIMLNLTFGFLKRLFPGTGHSLRSCTGS